MIENDTKTGCQNKNFCQIFVRKLSASTKFEVSTSDNLQDANEIFTNTIYLHDVEMIDNDEK